MTSKLKVQFPYNWIALAVISHLLAAFFSGGMHHWDEHFQILEFVNLKKGGILPTQLPWEYSAKMRPWLMPFIYYHLDFGLGPFITTFFYRIISVLLGLYALVASFRFSKPFIKNEKLLIILLCSLWFFPYIHARISAEAIGASLFMLSLVISRRFLSGFLMGISFYCRFHIGILILFYHLYQLIFKKDSIKNLFISSIGVFFAIGINILIDFWGYEQWVFSPWEYLKQNLIVGKVSSFGVNPWYDYFKFVFNKAFAPIGILIIISHLYLWVKHPKNILTWMTLPFFLIHTLIGHKELRFLFPLIHFVPVVFVIWTEKINLLRYKKSIYLLFALNLILLTIYSLKEVHPSYSFFRKTNLNSLDKLYILGDTDPYHLAQLPVRYYSSSIPSIKKVADDFDFDSTSKPFYVFSNRGKFYLKLKNKCELIYSNYPMWSLKINWGNWQKRSKVWTLLYCKD